jgi:hypothetical protein
VSERTLDSDLKTSAESPTFNYVIFVELAFPSGTVRVHNSVGTLEFGGNDYLGVGAFGSISPMEESIDLVDNPVTVNLSSITQEIIDAIKTDNIFGKDADIYLGALNADGELEGTPTNWISGYMEHASLLVGTENGISISIQTRASRLKLRNGKRFTLEDHQQDYSGDLFFEYLSDTIEAQVQWGGDKVDTGYSGGSGGGGSRSGRRRQRE